MFLNRIFTLAGLATIGFSLLSCSSRTSYLELPVLEEEVTGRHLDYAPANGDLVQINPPGFTWTSVENASRYRFLLFEARDLNKPIIESNVLSSTVMVLREELEAGEYCWMILYLDSEGSPSARTELMVFKISDEAARLPFPDMEKLVQRIEEKRPRLFLLPGRIDEIMEAIRAENAAVWKGCLRLADAALSEAFYPEPAPYKTPEFDVGEWRRTYRSGKLGSAHLVRLAFAYKLTGRSEYHEASKKWLLHLAGWDPRGITSYNLPLPDGSTGNDEAAMPMLVRLALAYDWLAETLDPTDRSLVLRSLRERGNQVFNHYEEIDFKSNPWSSHDGQTLAYLGIAALSCLGEFPEAKHWLEYTLTSYMTSFPSWGGNDGGWAQGLHYWAFDLMAHSVFLDALSLVADFDLYRKPFFRNSGFFPFYFQPPGVPGASFGDITSEDPAFRRRVLMTKLSRAVGDDAFRWYLQNTPTIDELEKGGADRELAWREWGVEDLVALLTPEEEASTGLAAPTWLPKSKWFKDIGWVAMHSDILQPQDGVSVYFKSSRYGSISHSHADQNSFHLSAFGQPLLIDSGYYPWYGSPHHLLWSKQTHAHNAVLVSGRGQGEAFMGASGKIEFFQSVGDLTFVRGEAGKAYNIEISGGTRELWQEHLSLPLPPKVPKVKVARRALGFAGRRESPWLVVHDYLETDGMATFEYLLHALDRMEIEEDAGIIRVRRKGVHLDIYLVSSSKGRFSQTDKFLVDPGDRRREGASQWHLNVQTRKPTSEVRYLALMVPYREGQAPLEVTPIALQDLRGFQVGEDRVLAWWGEGESGIHPEIGGAESARLFVSLGADASRHFCP